VERLSGFAFGTCICAISSRLALAGVFVQNTGIRVRNLFNAFTLRWDEIEKFNIGRSGVLGAVCRIHTHDGKTLRAFGIQESHLATVGSSHPAVEIAEALNQELAEAQNLGVTRSTSEES
jgi:Bacterial PH domain